MNLDPELQRKLSSLADTEESPLDGMARERIRLRTLEAAQGRQATWHWAHWAVAAATAATGALFWAWPDGAAETTPALAGRNATAPEGDDRGSVSHDVAVAPTPLRCSESSAPAMHRAFVVGRREAVDLGGRARFVWAANGEGARLATAEPCETVVELSRDRVAVHARDLAEGRLIVRTPLGDVIVTGTMFEVRAGDDAVRVAVAEGGVQIAQATGTAVRVQPGEVVTVDADGHVQRAALDRQEELALVRLLSRAGPVAAIESPPSTDEAPTAADLPVTEQVWRPGIVERPHFNLEVGGPALDADGRPAGKPRLIHPEEGGTAQ